MLAAFVLVVAVLVRSILRSSEKKMSVHSVYLRILTNHLQLAGIIGAIDFEMPSLLQFIPDLQKDISEAADHLLSLDCFINTVQSSVRLIWLKLVLYFMLPLIVGLVSFLFWFIYTRVKKQYREYMSDYITSTIVVVLFIVHPNICQMVFQIFNCKEVNNGFRMVVDLNVECY